MTKRCENRPLSKYLPGDKFGERSALPRLRVAPYILRQNKRKDVKASKRNVFAALKRRGKCGRTSLLSAPAPGCWAASPAFRSCLSSLAIESTLSRRSFILFACLRLALNSCGSDGCSLPGKLVMLAGAHSYACSAVKEGAQDRFWPKVLLMSVFQNERRTYYDTVPVTMNQSTRTWRGMV